VLAINNLGTAVDILLALLAVRRPLPVLEVLELFIANPHGLWDQLRRELQELRHVLWVKGLLIEIKLVLKAEEGIQHTLEVPLRIKYLMLRQFKGYYAVVKFLRDVIDYPLEVRLDL
jgi:hypothetical protein